MSRESTDRAPSPPPRVDVRSLTTIPPAPPTPPPPLPPLTRAAHRGFANESDDDFKPVRPSSARRLGASAFRSLGYACAALASSRSRNVRPSAFVPSSSRQKVHASGDAAVQSVIAQDVAEHRVLLYMKGTPSAPQCGFSNMACQILNFHGVEYETRNVLASEELRNGIKEFTSWPTIPQVFIDGEFVGGCDILRQMHSDGELEKALKGGA